MVLNHESLFARFLEMGYQQDQEHLFRFSNLAQTSFLMLLGALSSAFTNIFRAPVHEHFRCFFYTVVIPRSIRSRNSGMLPNTRTSCES